MKVEAFYDEATFTLTYVVFDERTKDAVIIDPVLDYDPLASATSTESVERVRDFVQDEEMEVHWILETHAHADHLTGSQALKRYFDAGVAIGENIVKVQEVFKGVFDLPEGFATDGSQFDRLLKGGETLEAGALKIEPMHTPGHTPACMSYLVEDAVFTGDALFIEDYGTGRCDFPAGSAEDLYHSVHDELYALPDETRVFVGHDYRPNGRELRWKTTIGTSKKENRQLRADTTKEEFVRFRQERDATLKPPRLIYQSVQVNIDAGRLPEPHENGVRYLKLPLDLKKPTDEAGLRSDDGSRRAAE